MTTLDLIQHELSHLDEPTLQQVYSSIEQISPTPSSKPELLSQLRQIKINSEATHADRPTPPPNPS